MKFAVLLLAGAVLALTGCKKESAEPLSPTNSASASTNHIGFVTAPVDYLKSAVQADQSMTKTIDVSYLNEALQQFNVQEGHYPKTLQELVPNYVGKLPVPPYGFKLNYDPDKGAVTVAPQ
jgi:hypothetical protein